MPTPARANSRPRSRLTTRPRSTPSCSTGAATAEASIPIATSRGFIMFHANNAFYELQLAKLKIMDRQVTAVSGVQNELAKIRQGAMPPSSISPAAAFVLAWLTQLRTVFLDKSGVTVGSTNTKLQAMRQAAPHQQSLQLIGDADASLSDTCAKL